MLAAFRARPADRTLAAVRTVAAVRILGAALGLAVALMPATSAFAQGTPIDDATLKREYDAYRASLDGMHIYGSHYILVASEDEARQLLGRLRIGGGDFATLARERSLHEESAAKGGDLGSHATCRWARATVAMFDKLAPGQLNPVPVKGSKGWGIYRLDSKAPVVPRSFERYREEFLAGRFEPECPWQPPVSVGATPAVKQP